MESQGPAEYGDVTVVPGANVQLPADGLADGYGNEEDAVDKSNAHGPDDMTSCIERLLLYLGIDSPGFVAGDVGKVRVNSQPDARLTPEEVLDHVEHQTFGGHLLEEDGVEQHGDVGKAIADQRENLSTK